MSADTPPPATPFVGSIALIRRLVDDAEEWLGVWDETSQSYRLPQADRGSGESFRSCLMATIEESLGLDRKSDFLISGLSRGHFQSPVEFPGDDVAQWVIVEFFTVDLYGQASRAAVERLPHARWLTMREVARGRTADGEAICPRQRILIDRGDLLPPDLRGGSVDL